jgi:hypothetical protein
MKKSLSMIGLAVALTACGGGGDDAPAVPNTPPASVTTAEGFWTGTASTGNDVSLAILENGETWGVYSQGSVIVGALYGQTTTSGSTLSGSGRDFNIPSRTALPGTYAGSFVAKTSVSVRTSAGGSFTGAYDTDYDAVPSLGAMAGTYTARGISVDFPTVTISSAGAIRASSSGGCLAAGTAVPRPGGKNIFNVTVTFSGSNCTLRATPTTTGIAYYDAPTRQLLVMALNSGKTDGFIYVGAK